MSERYRIDSDNVAYRIIDGEAVILNLDKGNYYSLNEIGTKVWEALNKKKSLDEIINGLQCEYQVSGEMIRRDTLELVKNFEKEKLVIKHK